jgi:RNA polymerase sigma-70 factor (ECF subfamily)
VCHPIVYDETPAASDRPERDLEKKLLRDFTDMRPRLLDKLTALLSSEADAQDALQTAFLNCWRARAHLGRVRNLRGWIWRVGMNAARDLRKAGWRRRVRPLETAGEEALCRQASPSDSLLRQEEQDRLCSALAHLRPAEREVFVLRHDDALTYQEIADRRGCPVGTAKPLMRNALLKLRRILHPKGE